MEMEQREGEKLGVGQFWFLKNIWRRKRYSGVWTLERFVCTVRWVCMDVCMYGCICMSLSFGSITNPLV